MEQIFEFLAEHTKKYSPFILGGAIGAVIHRLRTQMSFKQFLGSVVISIFVALSVGIVCQDYFKLSEPVIFVLCGISGTFSKAILDEIEEIIGNVSTIVKAKFGVSKQPQIEEGLPEMEESEEN